MLRNVKFLGAMLAASGLNFFRLGLASVFLNQVGFGLYSSMIGMAGLLSMLISLGDVEATTKLYPRLWVNRQKDEIVRDALAISRLLGWRAVAAASFGYAAAKLVPLDWMQKPALWECAVFALYVWFTSQLAICAAIIRAIGSVRLLLNFAWLRGLLPLAMVAAVLGLDDWKLAIIAETVGAGCLVAFGGRLIQRAMERAVSFDGVAESGELELRDNQNGRILYIANLFSSSISLADRAFVTAALGPLAGGTYGLLALISQAGALLSGIVSQKIGPEIIRAIHAGRNSRKVLGLLLFPLAVMAMTAAAVMFGLTIGPWIFTPLQMFLTSRGVGPDLIVMVSITVFLQFFLVLQFPLIALDDEVAVLRTSILAFATCAVGFVIATTNDLPLIAYVISIIVARAMQMAAMVVIILNANHDGGSRAARSGR
jgi:O-antigen/teichoic acid export membrane protein